MPNPLILVVDDDENNCLVTKRLLSDEGYEVDTAQDGLTALKLFGEQTHDLVILDYRMPDMDGLELLDIMKRQWDGVAVVFYTGYATTELVTTALEAGAKRVFPKDVDSTLLINGVKEILNSEAK